MEYIFTMKKKLYIETSVWNQLYQDERPDFQEITEKFLIVSETGIYDLYISDYLFFELEKCEEGKRKKLLQWIERISPKVLSPDEETETLMERYFEAGILEPTKANRFYDAAHVAIASVNGIEYLLTFNYKHLLKIKRMDGFNGVNMLNGYGEIRLITPEFFIPEENNEKDK
jgi:predicted nucleic acid-binding protein